MLVNLVNMMYMTFCSLTGRSPKSHGYRWSKVRNLRYRMERVVDHNKLFRPYRSLRFRMRRSVSLCQEKFQHLRFERNWKARENAETKLLQQLVPNGYAEMLKGVMVSRALSAYQFSGGDVQVSAELRLTERHESHAGGFVLKVYERRGDWYRGATTFYEKDLARMGLLL